MSRTETRHAAVRGKMDAWIVSCCIGVLGCIPAPHAASVFTKDNAMALAQLHASEQPAISIAIVAAPGESAAVAAAAQAAGGRVRYHFAPADFVSVVLPAAAVKPFLEHPAIEAAGVDLPDAEYSYRGLMPDAPPATASDAGMSWATPFGAHPLDHPYDVLRAIDADEFRKKNASFDGRGVVIAQVEAMSDLLVPELRTALDIHGREVPKFLDVLNNPTVKPTLDAQAPRSDWQWVALSAPLHARQGWLEHDGKRYRVPPGSTSYRLGTIEIPAHVLTPINLSGGAPAQTADTDHYSLMRQRWEKKTETFAVLWSDTAGAAWLDSNRNGDLTDEQAVREYRTSYDVGVLGRDDLATSRRESRAYVVQKDDDHLSLTMDCNLHATMVAGVASASRGDGGRMEGIAPGAQIIAIKHDRTYSGYSWALIAAFADERGDVVLIEASFPPAGGQAVKDGRSLLGALLSRLSRRYPKPSFFTAGNLAAMSAVADASVVPETISVGAYDTPESFRVHLGMQLPERVALHAIGSEGPAGNGALKPDLVAPSMMIAPRDGYLGNDSSNSLPGLYQLPEGYKISGGTSAATPIAAGAAALLVSAAKQNGLPHDAAVIKRALLASARYLSGAGSYQQGAGVMKVGAAWGYLRRHASDEPLSIEVSAPVHTANSHLLETPHRGVGVFEREGWRAGDRAVRRVTLTRRNGAVPPQRFMTRWQGNRDGTFEVAREVELPLGQPVALDITISPKKEAVYSATLQLIAESREAAAVAVPVTIVVPYELTQANGFAQHVQMDVPIVGRSALFVRVPEGVDALTFEASYSSKLTFLAIQTPTGDRVGFSVGPNTVSGKSVETIAAPAPGVWGVFAYDNTGKQSYFRTQPEFATLQGAGAPPPVKIDLRISAAAVSLAAGSKEGVNAQALQDGEVRKVTVKNTLASLDEAQLVGRIAAVRTTRGRIAQGEQRVFEVDVRVGAEYLVAAVAPTSAEPLDVDLYLFDCTGPKCALVRAARSNRAHERVFVQHPQPGRWRAILDASAAAAGQMQYEYTDFFTVSDAGVIAVADRVGPHAAAAEWQVRIKPWLIDAFLDDRTPAAALFLQDPLRTSMLGAENIRAAYGCKTYPYCGTERRESVPLGLMLVDLGARQDGR